MRFNSEGKILSIVKENTQENRDFCAISFNQISHGHLFPFTESQLFAGVGPFWALICHRIGFS